MDTLSNRTQLILVGHRLATPARGNELAVHRRFWMCPMVDADFIPRAIRRGSSQRNPDSAFAAAFRPMNPFLGTTRNIHLSDEHQFTIRYAIYKPSTRYPTQTAGLHFPGVDYDCMSMHSMLSLYGPNNTGMLTHPLSIFVTCIQLALSMASTICSDQTIPQTSQQPECYPAR